MIYEVHVNLCIVFWLFVLVFALLFNYAEY